MGVREADRVWFITGSASGLGRAVAEAALERGERVVATGRDLDRLRELQDRYPDRALAHRLDVTDPGEAERAVQAAIDRFGRIDVLVNNAGFGLFGPLEELADEELRREFDTNVFGAVNVLRASLPRLRSRRSGHIVQISSLEGVAPAAAGESAYAGTKFAVEGICETLAKEVAHLGIGVTIVEPGPIRTGFAAGATAKTPQDPDYEESVGKALDGSRTSPATSQTTPGGSPKPSSKRSVRPSLRSGSRSAKRQSRRSARSSTRKAPTSTLGRSSPARQP
jgi:NAD(P)-dependent dehydrogenase (short-subunit alcohol dehydrogenase family)